MSENIEFGIIDCFDKNRDYSIFDSDQFIDWEEMMNYYNCTSISYDSINQLSEWFKTIDTYACQYGRSMSGIDICGVTLIPPSSITELIKITTKLKDDIKIKDKLSIKKLLNLFQNAKSQEKYIICFGD